MGLDFCIEARVMESDSEYVLPVRNEPDGDGFFRICSWSGHDLADVLNGIIDICNRYNITKHTDNDQFVPILWNALPEIHDYIMEHSCISDDDRVFSQMSKDDYERCNLANAFKLHDLVYDVDNAKHYGKFYYDDGPRKCIDDPWLEKLEAKPKSFTWEFRLHSSMHNA